MHRVAGRVEEQQLAAGERDRHAVARPVDAFGRDADDAAVGAFHFLGAVDAGRALHEARRVDQVPRAARMDDEPRARQLLHEQADAAGVVEVNVGRDDEVDRVRAEPERAERGEQARHRVVGARVDEGGATLLDDEIRRVEAWPMKAGVDRVDAVAQRFDEVGEAGDQGFCAHRGILESTSRTRVHRRSRMGRR